MHPLVTYVSRRTGIPFTRLGQDEEGRSFLETESGDRVVILPDQIELEGDKQALSRIYDLPGILSPLLRVLERFPFSIRTADGGEVRVEIQRPEPPAEVDSVEVDSVEVTLRIIWIDAAGMISNLHEYEAILATDDDLEAEDFDERFSAWEARVVEALDDPASPLPDVLLFGLPPALDEDDLANEGWEELAARVGLGEAEEIQARVEAALDEVEALFPAVEARYRELYDLSLPIGLGHLAALLSALGQLQDGPSESLWEAPPGWARGGSWLDAAARMRDNGLLAWFAPGGLERRLLKAEEVHQEGKVPAGGEGPLDARLDWRFRADAPQLVTFAGGDTDGLHWGFWYDSPTHYPRIAHNYARDSAETWLDGALTPLELVRKQLEDMIEGCQEEFSQMEPEDESRTYPLGGLHAARVVGAHYDALQALISRRPQRDEPRCPWPRTDGHPVGSPTLALPPDIDEVPEAVPGFGPPRTWDVDAEALRSQIKRARARLDSGRPAYALALGLYLHWREDGALVSEAGALLGDAYGALGFTAFQEILRAHLLHRNLPTVAVFER